MPSERTANATCERESFLRKYLNYIHAESALPFQERTVTIRRQTVGGFGLSIKVVYVSSLYCVIHCVKMSFIL